MTQGISGSFKQFFSGLRSRWNTGKANPTDGGTFEPLTPVVMEGEQADRYVCELRHALENDQVRNIALTGGYGAGKSSVIRTFFDRHPEYEHIYVSLATFSKDTPVGSDVSQGEAAATSGTPRGQADLMSRIEETIVQQLLYAVPAQQVPKTRLKRIVQASNSHIAFHTVFFALLIICGLRLYLPSVSAPPKIDPDWLVPTLMLLPDWCALIFTGAASLYLLYSALRYLSLFSIDGLTLKGGKLEATHHGSVLHKHVDEIIYCFERSNIKVVVIEDLDRFGIQDVFFRLREINFTIQQSPQVRQRVHFIYAIRDELFSVGDKTKFFDLIIPVIPVVNSENSREKMMDLLGASRFSAAMIARLDPVLIETVCYYIDEMRLIKNIVNEFDMFSNLLRSHGLELDANKLFAMVVVRNLYPEAFAELIKRRGPIYKVFSDFSGWRIEHAQEIEEQIAALREKLEDIGHEHLESLEELRVCVWYQIVKALYPEHSDELHYGDEQIATLTEFVQGAVFDEVFKTDQPLFMSPRDYQGYRDTRKHVQSEQVLEFTSYWERYQLLVMDHVNLSLEIKALSEKSTLIKRMPFRVAAKHQYGEVVAQVLKDLGAMTYLMRAGYFDPVDYNDYLGFFYEGSLTHNDKNLILALRRGESPQVTAEVNNPAVVIGKLDHETLEDGRGLIAGLVDYLCSQYVVPQDDPDDGRAIDPLAGKLDAIFKAAGFNMERFAGLVDVVMRGQNMAALLEAIYYTEPHLLIDLLAESELFLASEPRQALVCAIFSNLAEEQVEALERGGLLGFLAELQDVSNVVPLLAAAEGTWYSPRNHPVRFSNLSQMTTVDELRQLLSWGCIAPKLDMLQLIFTTFEGGEGREAPVTYRRLLALKLDGVDQLLLDDPREFIEQLLRQSGALEESAASLSAMLTALGGKSEWVEPLLERTSCQLASLADAPMDIWGQLLNADKVSGKAEAVWAFFLQPAPANTEEDGFVSYYDDALVNFDEAVFAAFIKQHAQVLAATLWNFHSERHLDLQRYLSSANAIPNDIRAQLLPNESGEATPPRQPKSPDDGGLSL